MELIKSEFEMVEIPVCKECGETFSVCDDCAEPILRIDDYVYCNNGLNHYCSECQKEIKGG